MKVYVAAIYTTGFGRASKNFRLLTPEEKQAYNLVQNKLESYHYIYSQAKIDAIRRDKETVFLDSGAFSAFTKGSVIDLPKYCRYIQEHSDFIRVASVLDGIGDPEETLQNQLKMEALGVKPLPCFHYGEPVSYLHHYMKNYEYITIGGMVPISTKDLLIWLDDIWGNHLTDGAGRARLKVHGFGLTTRDLMVRYPWYSVDSSSWLQTASFGSINLGVGKTVPVSDSSPMLKTENQHVDNMSQLEKEYVENYIRQMGFDPDRLRKMYQSRYAFNLMAYAQMEYKLQQDNDRTFINQQPGLFSC